MRATIASMVWAMLTILPGSVNAQYPQRALLPTNCKLELPDATIAFSLIELNDGCIIRVQMVSSSHKETQPYKAVGRRLQLPSTLAREPQSRGAIRAMLGRHSLNSLRSEKRMSQI